MTQTPSSITPTATKIMLIRHAEKPLGNTPPHGVNINGDYDKKSLIVQGWQRAGALVVFFAPSVGPFQRSEIATPNSIYASQHTNESGSERAQQTVTPLIDKLGSSITVNFKFLRSQAKEVATSAFACHGVVLMCWDHQNIPRITSHFPISKNNTTAVPSEWPDDRYDVVWVFDLDSSGGYCFYEVPQLLLAGDTEI